MSRRTKAPRIFGRRRYLREVGERWEATLADVSERDTAGQYCGDNVCDGSGLVVGEAELVDGKYWCPLCGRGCPPRLLTDLHTLPTHGPPPDVDDGAREVEF